MKFVVFIEFQTFLHTRTEVFDVDDIFQLVEFMKYGEDIEVDVLQVNNN